jgi:polyhydroxybutyrate depolymerase
MDADSDRFGFIVVYPEGTNEENRFRLRKGYTWNAGNCCGWAQEHQIDDLSFTTAMLDKLEAQFNIDSKRIYATGFSNGAMMCYRLACELSNRIAAIATVGAPMGMPKCQPSRAVSVMHFHGTKDESAPYAGGTGRLSFPGQNFMPVEETIRFWLKALNLEQGKSRVTRIGAAVMETWGPAKEGAEVILWKLEGGGHTWPGGKFGLLGEKVLGKMNMDISANHEMWRFFQRHPMP